MARALGWSTRRVNRRDGTWLPRSAREQLARIHDAPGIERPLDRPLGGEADGGQGGGERLALHLADAVLGRNRPARLLRLGVDEGADRRRLLLQPRRAGRG